MRHVGESPTVPQTAIIERCTWVRIRLAMMESKVATGDFTEQDSNCYLAWANTLGRLLARLGLEPRAAAPQMDAVQYGKLLDARRAAEEAAA